MCSMCAFVKLLHIYILAYFGGKILCQNNLNLLMFQGFCRVRFAVRLWR